MIEMLIDHNNLFTFFGCRENYDIFAAKKSIRFRLSEINDKFIENEK